MLVLLVGCGDDSTAAMVDAAPDLDAGFDSGADASSEDATVPDAADDAGDVDAGSDTGIGEGSAGCGNAPAIATGEFVPGTLDVGGESRDWFVWLPDGYDPERAYPVVYQFHGCSDNPARENNNVPVQRESGSDAIHVRGRAVERCWDTSADGPDVAFFDAMVAEIEATYCADPARRFATGYSSGGFMSHRLACVRGDVLAGVATIGGAQGGNGCAGTVGALLIHDADDGVVNVMQSIRARDAHLERNGCEATTMPTDPDPCVRYDGCAGETPVVWCETSGMGHSRQDAFAAPAFWGFLRSL